MSEPCFEPSILNELSSLLKTARDALDDGAGRAEMENLLAMVTVVRSGSKQNFPATLPQTSEMAQRLKNVPPAIAGGIATYISEHCRACMFHSDDCILNILFLIFKSIEVGKTVEPKGLRPTLRIMYSK